MGFSTITSHIIMFIAVMSMATGLVVVFKSYVDESNGAMSEQWKIMSNNLKTDVTIMSTDFDNSTNITTVSVLNTGKTRLDPAYVDVYIDDLFVPRTTSDRTVEVEPSTDSKNSGIWDSNEVLIIEVNQSLENGSHSVDIATQYGISDTASFDAVVYQ